MEEKTIEQGNLDYRLQLANETLGTNIIYILNMKEYIEFSKSIMDRVAAGEEDATKDGLNFAIKVMENGRARELVAGEFESISSNNTKIIKVSCI